MSVPRTFQSLLSRSIAVNGSRKSRWAPASKGRLARLAVSDRSRARRKATVSPSTLARSSSRPSSVRGFPHDAVRDLSPAAFNAEAGALKCPAAMAALPVAHGAAQTYSARSSRNPDWRYGAVAINASRAARPAGDNVAARAVRSLAPNGFMAFRLTLVGAMDFRSLRSSVLMKTTPQVSAGFAQTAWVAYGMSRRGALAIRRDDRRRRETHYARGVHTINPQATHRPRYAYLVRRTGRIAGWREWRRNRALANRYSQEERVTSHHGPYAECYAMSNVIGFFYRKTPQCGFC